MRTLNVILLTLVGLASLSLGSVARADQWPACVNNGGLGFGDPWTDNNTQLAKDSADLNDSSICIVTPSAPAVQPAVGPSGYPYCVSNGGQGYGDAWTDNNNNALAKDNVDLDAGSICQVNVTATAPAPSADPSTQPAASSTASGYPYCVNNGGQGYGDAWTDSNTNTLAKDNADLNAGSICQVDIQPAVATDPATSNPQSTDPNAPGDSSSPSPASVISNCVNNAGQGFGTPWTDNNNNVLAKDNADLDDASICYVNTTQAAAATTSGYPHCLNNNGQGFGNSWFDGTQTLAKDSVDLNDGSICIVLNAGFGAQGETLRIININGVAANGQTMLAVKEGDVVYLSADVLAGAPGCEGNGSCSSPENLYVDEFTWAASDYSNDYCDASNSGSCFNASNFRVTQYGVSFYVGSQINNGNIALTVGRHGTGLTTTFTLYSNSGSTSPGFPVFNNGPCGPAIYNGPTGGPTVIVGVPFPVNIVIGGGLFHLHIFGNGPTPQPIVIIHPIVVNVGGMPHPVLVANNGPSGHPHPPVFVQPIHTHPAPIPTLPAPIPTLPAPTPIHTLPTPIHTLPTPIHTQPVPTPIHTQPVPTPIHTQPAPTPIHTQPAPTPIHTQPVPTPIHTQPAPTPIHTQPVPTPINTQPVPTPIHTQPVPTPIHTQPVPTPIHTQPAPTPIHTQPVPTPINTQPTPTPIHTQPTPMPIHTQPAPVHTQPVPTPIHTQPVPTPIHTQPAPIHSQPVPTPIHTQPVPTPIHTQPVPTPIHTQPVPAPIHTQPVPAPVHTQPAPVHTPQPVHSTQPGHAGHEDSET